MFTLLLIVLLIFTIHGKPLFAALGWLAVLVTWHMQGGDGLVIAFMEPFDYLKDKDMLLPIPMFTMAGYMLAYSGAPKRIIEIFGYLTSRFMGGMAVSFGIMALVVSAFFTPLTGASGVTIVALGGLLFPILQKQGYDDNLNLGIITASGSLGLLFFPSLPVILYGIISQNKAPIDELFIAGIVPGILLLLLPAAYIAFKSRKTRITRQDIKFHEIRGHLLKFSVEFAIIPLIFILFLNGSITIAEMGTVTLLYFFLLEVVIFKEIPAKKMFQVAENALTLMGGIMVILFFAMSFTKILIYENVPQDFFEWASQYIHSKYTFLILLNIFLLIVGALMDIFSAIVVVAPLVIPVAQQYDINMIHLGILFLTNLEIGYMTPPVGINLFISSFRFKKPILEVYQSIWPFLLVLLFAQVLITYIPELSLLFVK